MEWEEIILEFCYDITVKGFSPVTINNYRSKLKDTSIFFIDREVMPVDLKKKHINDWIIYMQGLRHQASTINIAVSRLKKMYDYMTEEEYISVSPFLRIKRLPEQVKSIIPLNEKEIKEILNATRIGKFKHINQRNTVILMLMLDCGLRLSEVTNLLFKDVLERQLLIRNSKNNKDRVVALSPVVLKEMMKYQRIKNKRYGKEYALDPENPYFVSYRRGKMCPSAIGEMLKALEKRVSIRKLRHHLTTHRTKQVKVLALSKQSFIEKFLNSFCSADFYFYESL